MTNWRTCAAVVLALAACVPSLRGDDKPGAPAQETPEQRDARMKWWREARFGMFIHWGVYSVPAGTYDGKQISGIGEWIMNRGKIPVARYAEYTKQFNPVKFDAEKWVSIAKAAGMKYIVITSKHHDGFAMFHSSTSPYNIYDATPFERDPLEELAAACKKQGIRLGFYYSQAQDWHHPGGAAAGGHWDKAQDGSMDEYLEKIAVPQVKEILTKYGPDVPAVLWWDTPVDMTRERAARFVPLVASKPGLITNNRLGGGFSGDTETPEQFIPATGFPGRDWETCMTMNDTWGFKSYDHNWKSVEVLIRNLVDIASKGGNYLLNVGPTSEGEIPAPSVERLEAVGKWMKTNGEAIYATSASPFKKLTWGRCTQKPGKLYLCVFDWPRNAELVVPMAGKVARAYLLGDRNTALPVSASENGVTIQVPATAPDPIASVVVAEIDGAVNPIVQETVVPQKADGTIELLAAEAEIIGSTAKVEASGLNANIGYWTTARDSVKWLVNVAKPGPFQVELVQACEGKGGSTYELKVGEKALKGKSEGTGSWSNYKTVALGTIEVPETGKVAIEIKPAKKVGTAVMNLRKVVLKPAPAR